MSIDNVTDNWKFKEEGRVHRLGTVCHFDLNKIHVFNHDKGFTVNLEIFARVAFSRNFACAKFCENKILVKWWNHSVV